MAASFERFTRERQAGDRTALKRVIRATEWREEGKQMNGLRSMLYLIARLLGDVNAVRRGRIGRRVARRAAGRATGRGLGRLFR